MAKKLKNVLSLLLALSMVLSMLCVTAFADGVDTVSEEEGGEGAGISMASLSLGTGAAAGSELSKGGLIESGITKPGTGSGSIVIGPGTGDIVIGPVTPVNPGKQPVTPTVQNIKVTYNENFPEGSRTETQTGADNETSVDLNFPDWSHDGYKLVRWTTKQTTYDSDDNTSYQGDTYTSDTYAGLTLYARWEKVADEDTAAVHVKADNGIDEYYNTVQEALNAVYDGNYYDQVSNWTLTLQRDVEECVKMKALPWDVPLTLTFDLNGYTLSGDGTGPVISVGKFSSVNHAVTFIIMDSVGTGTVTGGNATYGGAVYVSSPESNTTLIINGGNFVNNTAKCGGAISSSYQRDVPVVINGGTFSGNTAAENGGAVYARTVTVNGGTFTGNSASKGGAFYVVQGGQTANLAINKGEIYGNTASEYGDDIVFGLTGIYNRATTLNLMDASKMGVPGVDSWLVDGPHPTNEEKSGRVSDTHRKPFIPTSKEDGWPNTNKTGKAIIALKAAAEHEWAENYISDEDSHWLECVFEGCNVVKKDAHTPEPIPGVAPTYTSTGLTEGSKCSVCGRILVEQKTLVVRTRPSVTTPAGSDTEIDEPDVPLAEVPLPFVDVAEDSEYHDAVAYVYVNDLMDGVEETVFAPDTLGNRATVAMALYQLEKAPTVEFSGAFSDVEDGVWYTSAIEWGAANGLIKGYGNGKFGALDQVTREQLATFLYRYAQLKGYDVSASGSLSEFADGEQVSAWAKDAMSWAVAVKLFQADDNGCINSTAAVSRADIAMVLMQFGENVAK